MDGSGEEKSYTSKPGMANERKGADGDKNAMRENFKAAILVVFVSRLKNEMDPRLTT